MRMWRMIKDGFLFREGALMGILQWFLALVIVGLVWSIWYEATFDYSVCTAQDQYQDKHTPMWVQHIPIICSGNPSICTGGTTIIHPARDWTERAYHCPDGDAINTLDYFVKWRVENRGN